MPDEPTGPRRTLAPGWVVLVVALVAVRVVGIVVLLGSGVEDRHSILGGDARRYEAILSTPGTPYRDFDVEYPPVTLGLLELLGVGVDHAAPDPESGEFDGNLSFLARVAISQLALELAAAGLLAWAWNRRTGIAYLVLGTPFVFFPFPYARTDLLGVFLAVLALSLVRRHHDRSGGAALGVAVLAKLWPVVLAPLMVVLGLRRSIWAWALTLLVGAGLWLAFFGPAGFGQVATFRGSKGWQIESLPGVFFHITDPGGSHVEGGAWRTAAHVPLLVKPLLPALALGNAALAWWWAWIRHHRSPSDDEWATWALAPLASILGLLVFSTIISPQYLLWFVPFVAIIAARGDRLITGIYVVAACLTTFILATIHGQIEGRLYATLPIVARNACLVAMLAITLWKLAPRSSTPVHADRQRRAAVTA
jgi:hypothetical protein